jgi:hypothetical protein
MPPAFSCSSRLSVLPNATRRTFQPPYYAAAAELDVSGRACYQPFSVPAISNQNILRF